jgi:hypothetical protein
MSALIPAEGEWQILAANAVGASHRANGRPGQDAVRYAPSDHGIDYPLAVAVADGHGHRLHFRSHDGSRLAVGVACDTLLHAAGMLWACGEAGALAAAATDRVLPDLVAAWRSACLANLDGRPVTFEELRAAGFPEEEQAMVAAAGEPLLAYGSTLMAAAIVGRWVLLLHIGDGDIFTVGADGSAAVPVPGDPLLDGFRTTSLCQPDALGSFRVAVLDLADGPPVVIGLATDGYGNAQSSDVWQPAVGADLARYLRQQGRSWIGRQLGDWVARCASVEGSADDTTVALLVAPGAEARASAAASVEAQRVETYGAAATAVLTPVTTPATAPVMPPGAGTVLDTAAERTFPMPPPPTGPTSTSSTGGGW